MKLGLKTGWAVGVLCAGISGMTLSATAQEFYDPAAASPQGFGFSEFRAGVFSHSVYSGFIPVIPSRYLTFQRVEDLNVELLFDLPDAGFMHWFGSPRGNIGGTFNFAGRESMAHLALTWTVPVFDTPFFIEGTFGAAINNGVLTGATPPMRSMGCNLGFYESASVGVNVTEQASIMLTYEHTSNLDICPPNAGLSNMGVRFGYKFD